MKPLARQGGGTGSTRSWNGPCRVSTSRWLIHSRPASSPKRRSRPTADRRETASRRLPEGRAQRGNIDARILALLLRAGLICSVHIPCKDTRQRKEVLRQRCFFVRQRTMLRNRIHRLLGCQHGLNLPQVSDIFGKKGMSFLEKLDLPAPAGLLLKQQLEMLKNVQLRIKEDEAALEELMSDTPAQQHVLSLPSMGPILAAVVVSEIDDISRFPSGRKGSVPSSAWQVR